MGVCSLPTAGRQRQLETTDHDAYAHGSVGLLTTQWGTLHCRLATTTSASMAPRIGGLVGQTKQVGEASGRCPYYSAQPKALVK